jgi:hypothetical protein
MIRIQEIEGKGRGVVAVAVLTPDTLVEVAPVILIERLPGVAHTDYPAEFPWTHVFDWTGDEYFALVMGKASFINHSPNPNCRVGYDYENLTVSITTCRQIELGEELSFDYDCELWFEEAK